MEKYIALLRGINVGGHKKILMADLKSLLSSIGLNDVVTYIQSGNIVFSSLEETSNVALELKIEVAIKSYYGFDVPTIVMQYSELKRIIDHYPYALEDDLKKHLITFPKAKIDSQSNAKFLGYDFTPDQFEVTSSAIYLYCNTAYHKSKMGNKFFEKQLGVSTTTRNWQTSLKLLELCKS